jgi:hypothetical protein
MDAVLSLNEWSPDQQSLGTSPLWVIDFKVSQKRKLTPYNMQKGYGLQIALYALALQALGAEEVGLSIVGTASQPLVMPQVGLDALQDFEGLWRTIERVCALGVLGDRGERNFSTIEGSYPLATLHVDKHILDQKWALTHADFAITPHANTP